MTTDDTRGRVRLFVIFALLLLSLTQIGVSVLSWVEMREALRPEMDRKARIVAAVMADRVGRALDRGIPLDRLEGVNEYFARVLVNNSDIAWIGLETSGVARYWAGERPGATTDGFWDRFVNGGAAVSEARRAVSGVTGTEVVVAANPAFVRERMRGVLFDLAAVMLVSLFIAFEFMRYALDAGLTGPLDLAHRLIDAVATGRFDQIGENGGGPVGSLIAAVNTRILRLNRTASEWAAVTDGVVRRRFRRLSERFHFAAGGVPALATRSRLIDARLLTFLFMFAEGLLRPFLPVYVRGFQADVSLLPPNVAAGLPIAVFMLVVALGMPWAGAFSQRRGRRRGFVVGAALATVGLVGSGLAFTFVDLVLWRALDGLGYAMMFMAGQGFALDNTPPERRAEGMAVFVGGIMAAEICAPPLGGILADRIGDRGTFLAAGVLTALTLISALGALRDGGTPRRAAAPTRRGGLAGALLRNPRFLVLTLCAGFPAKMMLIGFLYYLVPLFATDLGAGRADVGRIAMLYGVPTLFLMPVFSRFADRWNLHGLMVGAGGLISGLGMLPILFKTDLDSLLLGVAALGVGQAMSISPQVTLAARLTEAEIAVHGHGPVLGVYRLIERCGSACGPFIFGVLATVLGYADAMALGGTITAVSSLLFCVVFLVAGVAPENEGLVDETSSEDLASVVASESAA